ncbi:unnamed protein product [Pleuronectes platessa]|uniref:Uncharacterized protein n=1 Tax=Pleuronectes platessa TaxID=8262 RepID=A0A9N7UH27_PLEPL|nr:unnamed protein product [Pleuronectes platessa]
MQLVRLCHYYTEEERQSVPGVTSSCVEEVAGTNMETNPGRNLLENVMNFSTWCAGGGLLFWSSHGTCGRGGVPAGLGSQAVASGSRWTDSRGPPSVIGGIDPEKPDSASGAVGLEVPLVQEMEPVGELEFNLL